MFKQRAIWGCRVKEHQSEEDLFDWRACKDSQATEALWLIFKPEEKKIRGRIKDSLQHLSDQDWQGQSSAQSFMLVLNNRRNRRDEHDSNLRARKTEATVAENWYREENLKLEGKRKEKKKKTGEKGVRGKKWWSRQSSSEPRQHNKGGKSLPSSAPAFTAFSIVQPPPEAAEVCLGYVFYSLCFTVLILNDSETKQTDTNSQKPYDLINLESGGLNLQHFLVQPNTKYKKSWQGQSVGRAVCFRNDINCSELVLNSSEVCDQVQEGVVVGVRHSPG